MFAQLKLSCICKSQSKFSTEGYGGDEMMTFISKNIKVHEKMMHAHL